VPHLKAPTDLHPLPPTSIAASSTPLPHPNSRRCLYTMSGDKKSLGHVVVTGGCGFLGHHIVARLLACAPATQISVVDVNTSRNRNSDPKVTYHDADFTDFEATKELFLKLRPTAIIHTASPPFDFDNKMLYKVNVEGTNSLLAAAKEAEVKAFVYTSSASVVWNWKDDLLNVDERWPTLAGDDQPEYYTSTKVGFHSQPGLSPFAYRCRLGPRLLSLPRIALRRRTPLS
jgi:hypothetical protein